MRDEWRRNYIKRYFLKLFLLIILLVGTMSFALLRFSKEVVGNEIIKLHQAILHRSAANTAGAIGDLKESLLVIAEDASLTEWLSEESGEENSGAVEALVQDEIYLNYKRGNPLRVYLYDLDGLRYCSDYPEVSWEDVQAVIETETDRPVEREDFWLAGPVWSEEAGLYRHSFYMIQQVKDLLGDRVVGYVCFQFSEKILYGTYSELREKDRNYYVVDRSGKVISGENKSEIGKEYKLADSGIILDDEAGYTTEKNQTADILCFFEPIMGTNWYLLEKADIRGVWETLDKMGYFTLCLTAVFVFCVFPLTVVSWRTIVKPVAVIKDRMGEVAEGNLEVKIESAEKGKGEFAEIADSFNYMAERLSSQVEEIRLMERKRHLLELDFLQAQINPHFIYNTLSSIRFYVEMGKNEEAEEMLIDFSKILRKTLSQSERFVSLEEEIETITHYVNLQKGRYRDRFQVEFDIKEETKTSLVPDFILQPIVENAIFYSLRQDQVCHIRISSYLQDQNLYVSVKDDGIGMEEERINEVLRKDLNMNKVGLKNVNERLKLNFGDLYGLKIISEKGKGTEVILEMPSTSERGKRG